MVSWSHVAFGGVLRRGTVTETANLRPGHPGAKPHHLNPHPRSPLVERFDEEASQRNSFRPAMIIAHKTNQPLATDLQLAQKTTDKILSAPPVHDSATAISAVVAKELDAEKVERPRRSVQAYNCTVTVTVQVYNCRQLCCKLHPTPPQS